MNRWRRWVTTVGAAGAMVLATALPAAASWGSTTNYGRPGYVNTIDNPGAQGGVCGDPNQTPRTSCPQTRNQIFIDRFRVYSAPYAARQSITVTAYLFRWDSAAQVWRQAGTKYDGCSPAAGNGSQYCQFGHPASDVGPCPCIPAFDNLVQGNYWTVVVRVSWYNYTTGAALAQADYRPGAASSDINCAFYATYIHRCYGPYNGGQGYLWMPVASASAGAAASPARRPTATATVAP